MASVLRLASLALLFIAVPLALVGASEDHLHQALAEDDACLATGADGHCALNALQVRKSQLQLEKQQQQEEGEVESFLFAGVDMAQLLRGVPKIPPRLGSMVRAKAKGGEDPEPLPCTGSSPQLAAPTCFAGTLKVLDDGSEGRAYVHLRSLDSNEGSLAITITSGESSDVPIAFSQNFRVSMKGQQMFLLPGNQSEEAMRYCPAQGTIRLMPSYVITSVPEATCNEVHAVPASCTGMASDLKENSCFVGKDGDNTVSALLQPVVVMDPFSVVGILALGGEARVFAVDVVILGQAVQTGLQGGVFVCPEQKQVVVDGPDGTRTVLSAASPEQCAELSAAADKHKAALLRRLDQDKASKA